MTTPKYRPDIDGLRAIAVLAVVFYHSGLDIVSGGYVGVDVFFVISGFLITTIIVREIADGEFSLAGFYERRMRRILPAIIATVAVCLPVGYLILEPRDFGNLAHSAIANNLFLSNIYFYMQAGYFDTAAELKPLLHTWSLSLEEQYYVVTPLLLMLVARFFHRRYLYFVIPSAVLSFLAGAYLTVEDQALAFYMLPTRAWELLIGSILAIATMPRLSSNLAMQWLALFGLALVVLSIVLFDDQTVFPGFHAALPTIGTAILIYTGRFGTTLVNRALSVKWLVFVGLISYSLYLWHWPVIVFSRYLKGVALNAAEITIMLAVTFGISVLSWRYVETPFRRKQLLAARKRLFVGSLGATAALILAGLTMTVDVVDLEWRRWRACEDVAEQVASERRLCVIGEESGRPSFLLWGDSHARALNSAANASASRLGKTGYIASKSACAPLRGIRRVDRDGCVEFNEAILDFVRETPSIETVILAGHWVGIAEGVRYKDDSGERFEFFDIHAGEGRENTLPELLETGLLRMIRSLQELDREVVVVGPVPEVGHDVPSVHHIAQITNRDVNALIAPSVAEFETRNARVLGMLARIEDNLGLPVLKPYSRLCDQTTCFVALEDGTALYRDEHHLSTSGARHISGIFDAALSN